MEIINHLKDFIEKFWYNLLPFYVINEYEFGLVLRFGRYHKNVNPGLVWKIPFVDEVCTENRSVTTMTTKNQSLTTRDGKSIIISAIVKYNVEDVKVFLLDVWDARDALNDVTQGKLKQLVMGKTWEEITSMKDTEIKDLVKGEANKWGIKIHYVTITDLVLTKTLRVIR